MFEENSINDLIKRFRECKTAAEERKFINKERGEIRLHMKDWGLEKKADAILKLIWINMMGFETNFAQVECMNALFFEDFRIKLIGYLGLTLFLSEKSEVLMMATNRVRIDLENKDNFFIIALALKSFSEITDKNMTVDLFQNIKELTKNDSKYIKKKALLACIRVLQKEPSLISELEPIMPYILNETNHGLLICALQLCKCIIKINPKYKKLFENSLNNLYDMLKTLQQEYQSQYQIDRVNDPFLQTYILDFVKDIVNGNPSLSGEFESQILMVYNNIKDDCSSSTLCLLYECARCIMQINSSLALKKIGIQILGKFLEMKHSNNLYLSLKMLYYASARYKEEIVKYDKLIQKCVKKSDFSIKRLAILILKNIANQENVDKIFNQIFIQYKKEKDIKHSKELFNILVQVIEKNPLSLQWYINKVLQLVEFTSSQVHDQDLFNYFDLISNHQELQLAFIYKSILLISNPQNWKNQSLIKSTAWVIGEFAELFEKNQAQFQVDVIKVIEIFQKLDVNEFENTTAFYIFSCLAKIWVKVENRKIQSQIEECFNFYSSDCTSLQLMKIYQYLILFQEDRETLEEIFEPVPPSSINEIFENIKVGEIDQNLIQENVTLFNKAKLKIEQKKIEQMEDINQQAAKQSYTEQQNNQDEVNFLDLDIDEQVQTKQDEKNTENADFDFLEEQNDQNQQEGQNLQEQDQDLDLLGLDNQSQDRQIEQPHQQQEDVDFFQEEGTDQETQVEQSRQDQPNEENLEIDVQEESLPKQGEELMDLNINAPQQNDPYQFLSKDIINNNLQGQTINQEDDDEFIEQIEEPEDQLPKIKFFENFDLILEYTHKKISINQNQIKIYFTNKQQTPVQQLSLKVAVKKNFKILSNFLNQQNLPPNSQNQVFQDLLIENVKNLEQMAMKLKLNYQRDGIILSENIMLQNVNLSQHQIQIIIFLSLLLNLQNHRLFR